MVEFAKGYLLTGAVVWHTAGMVAYCSGGNGFSYLALSIGMLGFYAIIRVIEDKKWK